MMAAGITSQYGFLYQRYVFINTVICHASVDNYFTYEGVDDIDINKTNMLEDLSMVGVSNREYIQVKSGTVDVTCWGKVLGNWLLTDDYQLKSFVLVCENDLDFDYKADDTLNSVYKYFCDGSDKKKTAVARKVYDKFIKDNDAEKIKEKIKNLFDNCTVKCASFETIIAGINNNYIDNYCSDIKIYERAKKSRCERMIEYFMAEIDKAIKEKKRYTATYKTLMDIVTRVNSEISDSKYVINTAEVKKKKQKEAETLVEESKLREVKQLRYVKDDPGFVARELVHEMLYKDLREIYENPGTEISNIEDIAYTNYQDVLLELNDENKAKEVFAKTIEKEIHSSIMPDSPIYRRGCYVYLTGEGIDTEKQISWRIGNE